MLAFLSRLASEPGHVVLMFFKSFVLWGKPSSKHGDVEDSATIRLVVTQAMSDLVDGRSSKTNMRLALTARVWAGTLSVRIFAQGEVGRLLEELGPLLIARTRTQDEARKDKLPYLDTYDVAKLQEKFCTLHGYGTVLVVASCPHAWRAIWTYQRLGLRVYVPDGLPEVVWGEDFEQSHWQSKVRAHIYELAARLLYLYKGYI